MAKQPAAGATQGEQQTQQSQPDQVAPLPAQSAGATQGEQSQPEQGPPLPDSGADKDEQGKDITSKAEESGQQDLQPDIAPIADKVVVTLLGPYKNYSKGDITSFHDEVAQHLIKSKLAKPYQAPELGQE